jgi:hypothetical protein
MNKTQIPTVEEIVELLLKLVPHTKVSHHVSGEIKLQIMLSILKLIPSLDLSALKKNIPGILDARADLLERSVTIQYNEQQLPYGLWESLMQLQEKPEQKSQVTERIKELFDRYHSNLASN